MKKGHRIDRITSGAIIYYCGFKIETELSFKKLCDSIAEKTSAIIDGYNKAETNRLRKNIEDAVSEARLREIVTVKDIEAMRGEEGDRLRAIGGSAPHTKSIEITPTDKGIRLTLTTELDEYLEACSKRKSVDYDSNERVYGNVYVGSYMEFILPPFEAKLVTGESVLLESTLLFFKNKTAIIRTTLPLKDVDAAPLFECSIDNYIVDVLNPFGLPVEPQSKTIAGINACYGLFIFAIKKVKAILAFAEIKNIVIGEYSKMPKHVLDAPIEVKEDLYRIIAAPVPAWKGMPIQKETEELFSKKCFSISGVNYILNNMSTCLSVVDGFLVEEVQTKMGEDYIPQKLIADIRRGAEYAICILLLKCVNNRYSFFRGDATPRRADKIKKEYNENIIFINNLQREAWGSAREQVVAFEEMMTYFLDNRNVQEKAGALNNILEEKRNRKIVAFQNLLSVMGVVATIMFGLPAISDTLKLLLGVDGETDPDFVRLVDGYSIKVWVVLLVVLLSIVILKSEFVSELKRLYIQPERLWTYIKQAAQKLWGKLFEEKR